jgi:hypothetical protein
MLRSATLFSSFVHSDRVNVYELPIAPLRHASQRAAPLRTSTHHNSMQRPYSYAEITRQCVRADRRRASPRVAPQRLALHRSASQLNATFLIRTSDHVNVYELTDAAHRFASRHIAPHLNSAHLNSTQRPYPYAAITSMRTDRTPPRSASHRAASPCHATQRFLFVRRDHVNAYEPLIAPHHGASQLNALQLNATFSLRRPS